MRGNVIGFDPDTNTGAISGHDGNRYDFVTQEWRGQAQPRHGDVVDFVVGGGGRRADNVYLIEAEYVPPTLMQFYFSPHARVSRSQYWLKFLLPVVIVEVILSAVIGGAVAAENTGMMFLAYTILMLFVLVAFWPNLAVLIKRAHDRDRPWPFILLMMVPIVQFWPLVELGFLRGTIGSNRFGPDPVPRS